jgi:hypothetical protein
MEPERLHYSIRGRDTCLSPQPRWYGSRPPSHFVDSHLNIILPSTLRSSKWYLSVRFQHQKPVCTSVLSRTCHMPGPSHSQWFVCTDNVIWLVQIMKLITMPSHLLPSCPAAQDRYPPEHHILKRAQPTYLFLSMRDQVSHPHKITGKIIFMLTLICTYYFWIANRNTEDFEPYGSRHCPSLVRSECFPECSFRLSRFVLIYLNFARL